jgi:hypothetical protein
VHLAAEFIVHAGADDPHRVCTLEATASVPNPPPGTPATKVEVFPRSTYKASALNRPARVKSIFRTDGAKWFVRVRINKKHGALSTRNALRRRNDFFRRALRAQHEKIALDI